jgi:hypothetical protein
VIAVTPFDTLTAWLLAQLSADEADILEDGRDLTARLHADVELKRDLVEWAQGIEYLRSVGDPKAPVEPLGEAVVRIIAERYAGRPGWDEEWRP